MYLVLSLVERNCFPIVVLLTTHVQSLNDYHFFFFSFTTAILKIMGCFIVMLERYSQDLSNGIVQAPKFQTFKLVDTKMKFALEFLSSRCPTFVW